MPLLVGFALAYFFASRFAKPVAAISAQAAKMADGKENIIFEKGFCDELDELSDTLEAAAQSIVKLENSRRELLANITHDLRTPLTLINGYAEKIEDLSWEEKEEARRDKHIEQGLYAMADEQRISQVFYNLVVNAITHVGEDNVVGLKAYQYREKVRAEIYDHGKGIAQTDIPHSWERYFTSRERKRSENGTGIGLSIVKEILNAHMARYGVISSEGQGSCFWLGVYGIAKASSLLDNSYQSCYYLICEYKLRIFANKVQ